MVSSDPRVSTVKTQWLSGIDPLLGNESELSSGGSGDSAAEQTTPGSPSAGEQDREPAGPPEGGQFK
jgi:hypothetical protein